MKRFLLGDDTGIGKTLQTIATFAYLLERNPNLKFIVAAPKSALQQWGEEIDKFTTGFKRHVLNNTGMFAKLVPESLIEEHGFQLAHRIFQYEQFFKGNLGHILICNYNPIVSDCDEFLKVSVKPFVICYDEATAFKSYSSKTHDSCKRISIEAERVYGLTATMLKNNLIEGYGIFKVIYPPLFGPITHFKKAFCIEKKIPLPGTKRKLPIVVGYKNLPQFRELIDPYFLGRHKHEVLSELPELVTKEVVVDMTEKQWDKYREALNGCLIVDSGQEIETSKLSAIIYCQEIADSPHLVGIEGDSGKETEFFRLLQEELEGEKIIVYSRFKKMILRLTELCKEKKIDTMKITGDENEDQRALSRLMFVEDKEAIKKFLLERKDKNISHLKHLIQYLKAGVTPKVFFINDAGGMSLNLQAASTLIFFDQPYSFGDYRQILGRMVRMGNNNNSLLAIHLLSDGSVDRHVLSMLKKKKNLSDQVLGKTGPGVLEFEKDSPLDDIINALKVDALKFGKKKS